VGNTFAVTTRAGDGPDALLPSAQRRPSIEIGPTDDPLEHAADRIVARVQGLRASPANAASSPMPDEPTAPASVHEALRRPGSTLDATTRRMFEPHLGVCLDRVRVHADHEAALSARDVGARAYTVGYHIAFGAGEFQPGTALGRALFAHELAHVQQRIAGRDVSPPRLRRQRAKPPDPVALAATQAGDFERIEDAYGAGSLDQTQWARLVDSAKHGDAKQAKAALLALCADVAKLAQAGSVVDTSAGINVVTGNKSTCRDAKPGLNLFLGTRDQWGARASTGLVDQSGRFVLPSPPGGPQPQVAIVLTASALVEGKEVALGILRHEMVHAEHDAEDAARARRGDPSRSSTPETTKDSDSELLGYVEGFMTMFHLTHPAPTDPKDPAFVELLGALDTTQVLPWAEASDVVRQEAERRLENYYCNALDQRHREAFDRWVQSQLDQARHDELAIGELSRDAYSPGSIDDPALATLQGKGSDRLPAAIRAKRKSGDFFRRLRGFAHRCKAPSMKL